MNERATTFGPGGELVGILTLPDVMPGTPDGQTALADRPGVLMWNVGVNHRVGPFRFNVELARSLAAAGYPSFRFDASGLGDSGVRRQAVREADREPLDVVDAMDIFGQRASVRRFVVIGYCSSVDAAHRVTMEDPRVVGAVHIEGYAHSTVGFRQRARRNLMSWVRWDRAVRRRAARLRRRLTSAAPTTAAIIDVPVYTRQIPTPEEFAADLVHLTRDLGKPHLFAYGSDNIFNGVEQFWEMFDHPDLERSHIDVRYLEGGDHTFYSLFHRQLLQEEIVRWMDERFPVDTGSAGVTAAGAGPKRSR